MSQYSDKILRSLIRIIFWSFPLEYFQIVYFLFDKARPLSGIKISLPSTLAIKGVLKGIY